jgi:enoyl-CoA hydratase/carnithine racemase
MTLQYAKRNQIAHFIIDSGKNNVLAPEFHKEFFHRLKEFELDPTTKVGLFYGAEGRCFSVGDDLKSTHKPQRTRLQELEAYLFLHQGEEKPQRPGWEHDVLALRRNKPIVSAVEGYCLGAAFLFCLAHSDVRVASTTAKFGLTGIAFGAGGASGFSRLARHLPFTAAAWLALSAEFMDAGEAYRLNLVNKVVPSDRLIAEAEAMAGKIARHSAAAIRLEMEGLQLGADLSRADAYQFGMNLYRMGWMANESPDTTANYLRDKKE